MIAILLRRCLYIAAILSLLCACAPCARSANLSQETAAVALLGEAGELIELGVPPKVGDEAIRLLDRLEAEYADTSAISKARLRRAQCLMFLNRFDEAIDLSRQIVAAYPNTVIAAWAQTTLGESLVKKGDILGGVAELWKVSDMLPNGGDITPLNAARGVLGRVFMAKLKEKTNHANAKFMAYFGLDASDVTARARVLATVAVYKTRQDRFEQANTLINRLWSECPDEAAELDWAVSEIAQAASTKRGEIGAWAAQTLSGLCSSAKVDHETAKAHLVLAEYYKKNGNSARSLAILKSARDRHLGTASGAQILCDLGNALYLQGQDGEALATLKKLVDKMPLSGYVAPALYSIGMHSLSNRAAAIEALTTLAEGGYDRSWRGLALWRLGGLFAEEDKAKATDCYTRAIQIFETLLSESGFDPVGDRREMISTRIGLIRSEMYRLTGVQEVAR